MTRTEDQAATLARLAKTADVLARLEAEYAAEKAARDALIIQARSEGHPWSAIARAAGRSITRCVAVVDSSF